MRSESLLESDDLCICVLHTLTRAAESGWRRRVTSRRLLWYARGGKDCTEIAREAVPHGSSGTSILANGGVRVKSNSEQRARERVPAAVEDCESSAEGLGGRQSTPAATPRRSGVTAMSSSRSHATSTAVATASGASHSHHSSRKHRSRSSTRFQDLEKPKKKKYLPSGSTSLVSIPNTIKLSMLNSGLISIGETISV